MSRRIAKVPRLALRNNLYRGDLPVQFQDLTWIEEKICAIYCVTAHHIIPLADKTYKSDQCTSNCLKI
ncbi:uncharacterized protein F5147DRAFT_694504 [Suillus discolor]|uniref:DUF6570 domain-containing protein n=1 Tax=Suillus discolor TaxID=1912936 RepID=A0A9P7JUM3_9AGAM|nr:uncharacterized protein F5147DRAFT_694504 [Suillus discolor]KAG2108698.1 hypothetical protein F5147DRAFT_694504 [Suillus discolor]